MIEKLRASQVFITRSGEPSGNDMKTPAWFDKINELVDVVNSRTVSLQSNQGVIYERLDRLEQHTHKFFDDRKLPPYTETGTPITDKTEVRRYDFSCDYCDYKYDCGRGYDPTTCGKFKNSRSDRINEYQEVIKSVYELAKGDNPFYTKNEFAIRLDKIASMLKPLVEGK